VFLLVMFSSESHIVLYCEFQNIKSLIFFLLLSEDQTQT